MFILLYGLWHLFILNYIRFLKWKFYFHLMRPFVCSVLQTGLLILAQNQIFSFGEHTSESCLYWFYFLTSFLTNLFSNLFSNLLSNYFSRKGVKDILLITHFIYLFNLVNCDSSFCLLLKLFKTSFRQTLSLVSDALNSCLLHRTGVIFVDFSPSD